MCCECGCGCQCCPQLVIFKFTPQASLVRITTEQTLRDMCLGMRLIANGCANLASVTWLLNHIGTIYGLKSVGSKSNQEPYLSPGVHNTHCHAQNATYDDCSWLPLEQWSHAWHTTCDSSFTNATNATQTTIVPCMDVGAT